MKHVEVKVFWLCFKVVGRCDGFKTKNRKNRRVRCDVYISIVKTLYAFLSKPCFWDFGEAKTQNYSKDLT